MQAKRALGVVATLRAEEAPEPMAALAAKLDQLVKLSEESLLLQKFAQLEPGHVLRFHHGLTQIALSLPDAQEDYLQRMVLRGRHFYEAKLLETVQGRGLINADSTVCDIGSNIGTHAVFFGKVLGAKRVLAFEPHPHCHATLCRNLELNGMSSALAYNCMVGAASGRGTLVRFNSRNLGASSFAPAKTGPVPMVALDDLIEAEEMQGLSFIKVDVEGMHLDVLNGAKKVIKAFRPALWVALTDNGAQYPAVSKLLGTMGYGADRIGPNDYIFTCKK